jgi:hypothetical protein
MYSIPQGIIRNGVAYLIAVPPRSDGFPIEKSVMLRFPCHTDNVQPELKEVDGELISICRCDSVNGAAAITTDGRVFYHTENEFLEEKERIVSDDGALFQIREIDRQLFTCGINGQIYRKNTNEWQRIDIFKEVPNLPRGIGCVFNDINGNSKDNIYVVGFEGIILHFNGIIWSLIPSPDKKNLERIIIASDGYTYIAGMHGTILKGKNNEFKEINIDRHKANPHDMSQWKTPQPLARDIWGLTEHKGKIYACSFYHAYEITGEKITPLFANDNNNFYRLESDKNSMFAIGATSLTELLFDKEKGWVKDDFFDINLDIFSQDSQDSEQDEEDEDK